MHLAHRANHARPQHFNGDAQRLAGMRLVAHLRGDLRFTRCLAHLPRFPRGMHQRLLAVDMLARLQREHHRQRVRVVRRADDHRVDVFLTLEHAPIVRPQARVGEHLRRVRQVVQVHIAQGDDVLAGDLAQVVPPAPADANHCDVQFIVGRVPFAPAP
jgi:hypothetical protein